MSWAEVKKINSDLSTPLNILATIQHIDMVGENYVCSSDKLISIINNSNLYSHPIALHFIGQRFFDIVLDDTHGIGSLLNSAFQLGSTTLASCESWNEILLSQTSLDLLATEPRFFLLHDSLDSTYFTDIYGNSSALIMNSRQGLFPSMERSDDLVTFLQANVSAETILLNNSESLLTRTVDTYTVTNDGNYFIVALGAGEAGGQPPTTNSGGVGGAGGAYFHKNMLLNIGDEIDYTVSDTETSSSFLNISLGAGGGAGATTTPTQAGKIIKVASNGGSATGGGGGGGFGGGNGGAGYGQVGVTGPAILPIVAGTGGAGGLSYDGTYGVAGLSGTGGGGGGGCGSPSNNKYSGAGGAGYGGGGGGGARGSAISGHTTGGYGGKGGSGGFIILK